MMIQRKYEDEKGNRKWKMENVRGMKDNEMTNKKDDNNIDTRMTGTKLLHPFLIKTLDFSTKWPFFVSLRRFFVEKSRVRVIFYPHIFCEKIGFPHFLRGPSCLSTHSS